MKRDLRQTMPDNVHFKETGISVTRVLMVPSAFGNKRAVPPMFYFTARHTEQLWVEMVPCDFVLFLLHKERRDREKDRRTDSRSDIDRGGREST